MKVYTLVQAQLGFLAGTELYIDKHKKPQCGDYCLYKKGNQVDIEVYSEKEKKEGTFIGKLVRYAITL